MISVLLNLALLSAQATGTESLFSCAAVTISQRGRIVSPKTVVSSGDERSDHRANRLLKSLDLSRIEMIE
jgi:hypothetical protein